MKWRARLAVGDASGALEALRTGPPPNSEALADLEAAIAPANITRR